MFSTVSKICLMRHILVLASLLFARWGRCANAYLTAPHRRLSTLSRLPRRITALQRLKGLCFAASKIRCSRSRTSPNDVLPMRTNPRSAPQRKRRWDQFKRSPTRIVRSFTRRPAKVRTLQLPRSANGCLPSRLDQRQPVLTGAKQRRTRGCTGYCNLHRPL